MCHMKVCSQCSRPIDDCLCVASDVTALEISLDQFRRGEYRTIGTWIDELQVDQTMSGEGE